jgi:recombination protein RecA
MAKKDKGEDLALENYKGFFRKGASARSPGNIPTGYPDLDFAIHYGNIPDEIDLATLKDYNPAVPLGLPRGKLVEIFGEEGSGKSSVAYRVVGYAQKMGFDTVWIDAENSFSDDLAYINGANKDEIIFSDLINDDDPNIVYCAEDIFDEIINICKTNCDTNRKKKIGVIVLDSVANLIPKVRMEAKAEQHTVGIIARLLSENLKKVINYAAKYGVLVIFINQVREKIGVLFGCASYKTKILLADGSWRKIGPLVNNKEKVEVLSYDLNSNKIVPKKVIGWHNNGNIDDSEYFLKIKFRRNFSKNVGHMHLTPNHSVFINQENVIKEIEAKYLKVNDLLCITEPINLNEVQLQVAMGSLLGDGSFQPHYNYLEDKFANVKLRLGHGKEQADYCRYKAEVFNCKTHEKPSGGTFYAETLTLPDFQGWDSYKNSGMIPEFIANNSDEVALAIWYLDDGTYGGHSAKWGSRKCSISCKKFKNKEIMLRTFAKFNIFPTVDEKGFTFDSENTYNFHMLISRFVPPSMAYKIHPDFHLVFEGLPKCEEKNGWKLSFKPIVSISKYKPKHRTKFDLTIEDNGNYFAGGALIHNSNETTPGGHALKHGASIRIRIGKSMKADNDIYKTEDGDSTLIGRKSHVSIPKNRFAKPYRKNIEIKIWYEPNFVDIDQYLFSEAQKMKIIKVSKKQVIWEEGNISVENRDEFLQALKFKDLMKQFLAAVVKEAKNKGLVLPPEIHSLTEETLGVNSDDNVPIIETNSESVADDTDDDSGEIDDSTEVEPAQLLENDNDGTTRTDTEVEKQTRRGRKKKDS